MNHKVIIYAEMNGGRDISEKELRLIVKDLESRGFNGYYDRTDEHNGVRAIIDKLVGIASLARNAWDSI
jgi:hypothetical protein